MESLVGIGIMASMLALRLAVPVALTAAVVYLIRRLDARMHPRAVTLR
jgi:hypothetical protein